MPYAVAVDIGGTFTDLVAYDRDNRRLVCTKSPTTYEDFVKGIVDCFDKAEVPLATTELVNHGTTLVINALLQRKGAKTALVTTKGFRDVLEIARANRPDPFDLHYSRDEPLIPRDLRFEIGERVNSRGEIVRPLDPAEVRRLADTIQAAGVQAVAIFLINSYANSGPEADLAQQLRALLPDVYITCSTELTREWYEYERSGTVAANAYVGPDVDAYLRRLRDDLGTHGFKGALNLMGSNGGLLSVERARRQPVALVESGPVGGCIGAAAFAKALNLPNVIAFDMGGTTAKCAHVAQGSFAVETTYYVGGYTQGFPIRSSVIDIVEVGSGGGSIARLDAQGRLSVGPQSAGSTPGPVCYGRGGTQPTITDANLVLGRLNPRNFLGGEINLDEDGAKRALEVLGASLGYTGPDGAATVADGVIAIATLVMADAIKQISVKQGLDPRDFVLFCYGGGGPLHASSLARELSIPEIIIPPEPGNFSAVGMLISDARLDFATTFVRALDDGAPDAIRATLAQLEQEAFQAMANDYPVETIVFERFAEMRYVGQRHNIKIGIDPAADADGLYTAFCNEYRRRYGHADPGAKAEIQALHVSAIVVTEHLPLSSMSVHQVETPEIAPRKIHFGRHDGWQTAACYWRSALTIGFKAVGPAVIEEYGSTTLVWPGDTFEIGALREIRIKLSKR
jgi:N-methylhydantoinase A